jgi:hypothetical protein
MGTITRHCGAILLGCLAVPALAAAQDQGFAAKIRTGQKVIVREVSGAETRGIVQQVDASTLVIKYGVGELRDPADPSRTLTDTRTFTAAEVERVRRPGPIWDGAVKGALVGLVPAVILAAAECYDCGEGTAAAAFMAIGAGIGIGIDAAWGPKTVYRNRAAGRVALVPVISKDRRALTASIRF